MEKKNAFPKLTKRISKGLETKTAKTDSKKGNKDTHSRPTIDTGTESALRIRGIKELPADRNTRMPQIKPESQKNARKKVDPLRRICSESRCKKCATKQKSSFGMKNRRSTQHRHSDPIKLIHPYYTPKFTKIQAFLAKLAFFVDYDDIYVNIIM